ncbi:hypothetical protein DDZ13_02220 [Coraliomargarita sinensis]|uniref:DUF4397 domain-containing protein n=1 Tax=Coraliomargarita sinensis TaxID=2174842 RepID=A0A317ZPB8_9BACT|nr:hypothetical protein [Coraliomargarita sinensis]PXA05709.1 hypothetical protein DDZ13_02220 [Coraliomargarita sinensis]
MKQRATAIILALFFCLQAIPAQQNELTSISFTVYGLRPGNYSNIYFQGASDKPTALTFHRKRRSGTYTAQVPVEALTLKFLQKGSHREEHEEGVLVELGSVPLPPDADKILFVFVPQTDSGAKNPFKILSIEDGGSSGQSGTVRIINLTALPLIGMAEGEKFELQSLSCSQPFELSRNSQTDLSILAKGSSRHHLVYRNSFRIDPESRAILFLTPPYRKASLKLGGHMLYEEL